MSSEKKSRLPCWMSFSLPELRCLLNIVLPVPRLAKVFRLRWFWWRRQKRLQAIASRYHIPATTLLRLAIPP